MRLSTILELLLIFLLIAFAAYGRVIVPEGRGRGIEKKASARPVATATSLKQATENVNKYCTCNENICNCCREFHIPLVQLSGPGCASLQYLQDDKLAMQLSIGDNILSSNVVSGKNPKPVCVALPGGFSKFCGKIYSIKREADKHFKACLGLELRSASELEASLRVSCFRFGPDGLKLRPAEPLPAAVTESSTSSNDDDYEDLFGLDDDDDEDEDEEDEDEDEDDQKTSPEENAVAGSSDEPQDAESEDDEDDYGLGFDPLGIFELFAGDDETDKKKPPTSTALPSSFAIPILALTSSQPPLASEEAPANKNPIVPAASAAQPEQPGYDEPVASSDADRESEPTDYPQDSTVKPVTERNAEDATTYASDLGVTEQDSVTEEANKNAPAKADGHVDKLKFKKPGLAHKKKVSITSQSVNAIQNDGLKPQQQQQQQQHDKNKDEDEDEDEDDDEDEDYNSEAEEEVEEADDDSDEEDEEEEEGAANAGHADKNEGDDKKEAEAAEEEDDEDEDDEDEDESEEEEDAVLSALVDDDAGDEKESQSKKKPDKSTTTKADKSEDEDYSDEIAELLARKQPDSGNVRARQSARQSKVMRF